MLSFMHYNLGLLKLKPLNREILFSAVAFLLGLALPSSTLLLNIVVLLMIICVGFQRNTDKLSAIFSQPLVFLPILIFLLLVLSLLYRDNPEGVKMVLKYKKLLFIPLFALFFFIQRGLVEQLMKGFLWANAAILIISTLVGVLHLQIGPIDPANPTIFKLQITQNFFMALATVIWVSLAYYSGGVKRLVYAALAILAIYNILFLVLGRTGYIALFTSLLIWLLFTFNRWKRVLSLIIALGLASVLLIFPNPARDRMNVGIQEAYACVEFHAGTPHKSCDTSIGLRTDFLLTSLSLLKTSPLLGLGAGGFVYKNPNSLYAGHNPHNQYVLEAVQSGLVGLLIFLAWLFFCYRAAWRQEVVIRNILLALISAYVVGNLFNSFLIDFSESFLFVILSAILIIPRNNLALLGRKI